MYLRADEARLAKRFQPESSKRSSQEIFAVQIHADLKSISRLHDERGRLFLKRFSTSGTICPERERRLAEKGSVRWTSSTSPAV